MRTMRARVWASMSSPLNTGMIPEKLRPASSPEPLLIGAFGDPVPRIEQRLELRERRIDLLGHGALLGLLLDHLARDLLEVAQDGSRELDELDLALELGL